MSRKSDKLIPIIAIVGKSGSGKTTLIEKLLPEFKRRGYRVGTIKHHIHAFEIDREGKDSWRHARAGAESVALISPCKLAFVTHLTSEMTPEEMRDAFFQDVDLILAEGYKGYPQPKIEVFRSAVSDTPICTDDDQLLAIVSDCTLHLRVPCFELEAIGPLADFLEERVLRGGK
jgi:molybdopterin-guanine dinucleotide biosynthesis protein B